MVYVFLAPGFEEIEGLLPVDVLRRAGIEVITVGVPEQIVTGSHGITIQCDISLIQAQEYKDKLEMIILPGGMPGAENLFKTPYIKEMVEYCVNQSLWIGAICAAPMILGQWGLLSGYRATCYPGFEKQMLGAKYTAASVEQDGLFITSNGPSSALTFALRLVEILKGQEIAYSIKESMGCL